MLEIKDRKRSSLSETYYKRNNIAAFYNISFYPLLQKNFEKVLRKPIRTKNN